VLGDRPKELDGKPSRHEFLHPVIVIDGDSVRAVEKDLTRQHLEFIVGHEFADDDLIGSVACLDLIKSQDLVHRFLPEPDSVLDRLRNLRDRGNLPQTVSQNPVGAGLWEGEAPPEPPKGLRGVKPGFWLLP
jgi:hypothetical protein